MLNFTLHFEDGTIFEGNSLDKTWLQAPEKSISKLEYLFNDKRIIFEGFGAYNHLIEDIFIVGSQFDLRENIFILGRNGEQTVVLWFHIPSKKIVRAITSHDKEVCYIERNKETMKLTFREGKLAGWKEGFFSKPKIYLAK